MGRTTTLTEEQVAKGPVHSHIRSYFYTAAERHRIYMKRIVGRPREKWTNDPILYQHKFCNVYRELDKVTVWLRKNWREPYADHPNLPFAMSVARLINWPPTLEEIGFPKRWQPKRVLKIMQDRKARGDKLYTGAYLLGGGVPPGEARAPHLVNNVLTSLHSNLKNLDEGGNTLEGLWERLKLQSGVGNFLAYEIVSDLRHTKWLRDAPDIMTWANAGPGALRGLARLWGYQPTTRKESGFVFPKGKPANEAMQMILKLSKDRWPGNTYPWEMREVEHWLCEYDKICRIKNGQGVLERFEPKDSGEW